jgi:hypothetical protein
MNWSEILSLFCSTMLKWGSRPNPFNLELTNDSTIDEMLLNHNIVLSRN